MKHIFSVIQKKQQIKIFKELLYRNFLNLNTKVTIQFQQNLIHSITHMQTYAKDIQQKIWTNLFNIYSKYTSGNASIDVMQIESIVRQILDQDTQSEVDYVVKNLFRLDVDNNGSIDFEQFANFLLKRHCGEIALQKFHKSGKISKPNEMKINVNEFCSLLNHAYSFLGVSVIQSIAKQLFKNEDTDGDGDITYVQYFKFIQKYLCKDGLSQNPQKTAEIINQKQIISRLRKYIWNLIKKLYDAYDYDGNNILDTNGLRKFLMEVLHITSQKQIHFFLYNVFKIEQGSIQFLSFGNYLLVYMGELGLSRYSINQKNSFGTLSQDDFIRLFRETLKFLNIQKVKDKLLHLIFAKIDSNHDDLISFEEYIEWVTRFLAPYKLFSREFLVDQDDEESGKGKELWMDAPRITNLMKTGVIIPFKFSNYDLSIRVRQQTYRFLIPFDFNKNKQFEPNQIQAALRTLLKENQYQLPYFLVNVRRYDKNRDGIVTYDQLTDFFVEQHCGQMAIQRLHRKKKYSRGANRILNRKQFGETISVSLSYIDMKATQNELNTLFNEVDLDQDGWISYSDYFLFLRYYFGSFRNQSNKNQNSKLNPVDIFIKMIKLPFSKQLKSHDRNRNLSYDQNEIIIFLREFLKENQSQITSVINILFTANINSEKELDFTYVLNLLIRLHVGDIIFKRFHKPTSWKLYKINFDQFVQVLNNALSYLTIKPSRQLLFQVFKFIDTNKDGWISYQQYYEFVFKYLGQGVGEIAQPQIKALPPSTNSQQNQFYDELISQLRIIYEHYDADKNGHLDQQQLTKLIGQVLKETTKRQIDYVFWNLFRVDLNKDRKIEFHQFAPFMLKHSPEIALQRFHVSQVSGKNTLKLDEFIIVIKNAYGYLKSMPRRESLLTKLFNKIDQDGDSLIGYRQLLGWAHFTVAARIK